MTDPDAKFYSNGTAIEAKLAFFGHAPVEKLEPVTRCAHDIKRLPWVKTSGLSR